MPDDDSRSSFYRYSAFFHVLLCSCWVWFFSVIFNWFLVIGESCVMGMVFDFAA